jgi:hopanoid biosynthesis associated protein HpnK
MDGAMIKVIVNADDFGLSGGVNEGIIRAHREGILTSATLMANMPGFDQAVALARANPGLGVGVHLNIVRGRPVLPPERIPSVLRRDGRLYGSVYKIIPAVLAGRLKLAEVEAEWRAQIDKAAAAGIAVTHLDSEKHMHAFRPFFRIALKLAVERGIRAVRLMDERCLSRSPAQLAKAVFIGASCRSMRKAVRNRGIMTVDRFYGICHSGRMTAERLRRVLERVGEGVSEIMVHPGLMTDELRARETEYGASYINNRREVELEALLDEAPRRVVRERGIRLISYGGM